MKIYLEFPLSVLLIAVLCSCNTSHKVEMKHELKPIHIKMDINVKVDVNNELDKLLDEGPQNKTY